MATAMDGLLQHARWRILKQVSEHPSSATELAKRTGGSVPNMSQQLKLLEAYDLVKAETRAKRKAGKPSKAYRLSRPYCQIALVRQGFAEKRSFSPHPVQVAFLSALLSVPAEDQPFVVKALLCNEQLLESCAIAYLKRHSIQLFAVTEDVERIREQYSSIPIEYGGTAKRIAVWSHTVDEILDGLSRNEQYYQDLVQDMHVLHDTQNEFQRVVA